MFSTSTELRSFLEKRYSFHSKQSHFWRLCHYLSITLIVVVLISTSLTIIKDYHLSWVSNATLLWIQIPLLVILILSVFYFKKFKILWKVHQSARFNLEILKIEMIGNEYDSAIIKKELIKNTKHYHDTLKQLFASN